MALIECKECGHKVSDKAECCPNCGCPIEEIMSADASNDTNVSQVYDDAVQFDDIPPKKSKGWLWTIVVILVLAAIGVGVWLFTNGKLGEDDPTTAKVEITPEFIAAVHQYDELYPFSEGLAAVKKDGKFGYINTKGELVIPCQFDKACDFSDGLAIVMDDEYNIKILDIDGSVKSTPYKLDIFWYGTGGWHYDKGYYSLGFHNNRCAIKTNNSEDEIVIDANGTIITHPSEQNTLAFEHNITDTISHNPVLVRFSVSKVNMYHNEVERYGIKDSSNRILVQPQFFEISDFHNGVAQVVIFIGQAETKGIPYGFHLPDGEYFFGYVDKDGYSTFTDADFKKIEAYKKEQLAKKEELDRQAAEEEQARLEEERRQEELQQHPENQFNKLLGNTAWRCLGYSWVGHFQTLKKEDAEFVVAFRPINDLSGYASFVKWDGHKIHEIYTRKPSQDDYRYAIKGDIIELKNAYPEVEMSFKITYQDGTVILRSLDYVENGKFYPIEKSKNLFPNDFDI